MFDLLSTATKVLLKLGSNDIMPKAWHANSPSCSVFFCHNSSHSGSTCFKDGVYHHLKSITSRVPQFEDIHIRRALQVCTSDITSKVMFTSNINFGYLHSGKRPMQSCFQIESQHTPRLLQLYSHISLGSTPPQSKTFGSRCSPRHTIVAWRNQVEDHSLRLA